MSGISLQDSQLQFYDAIESLTSDSGESDNEEVDDSEAEDGNNGATTKKRQSNSIAVPGELFYK